MPTGCGSRSTCSVDPAFDALLTGSSTLAELPEVMARLADGDRTTICHTVTYGED